MPTPPVPYPLLKQRIEAINEALKKGYRPPGIAGKGPGALQAAATALGIPHQTLQSNIKNAKHVHNLEPDWSLWEGPRPAGEIPLAPSERQRLNDRIGVLEGQLREALREIHRGEDFRRAVFGLANQPIVPPKWTLAPQKSRGRPGTPILFASDFQWGEVIRKSELIEGINEYNPQIAAKRYERLIERTISLCFDYTVNPKYPGLIYVRGGDMISGDIHDELQRTNELESIPAVTDLAEKEIAGITALADKFGKVQVISVPGNHGRVHRKPYSKRYVATNYDTLGAWIIEKHFLAKGDGRVTVWTPESGDAMFTAAGWKFLATHGDRIGSRGGQGFIGPAATITRGMKKLVDQYAALGQMIDFVICGHFHTALELEYGFSNGSLAGYSEYAGEGRFRPAPPTQWLLVAHPEHGITHRWQILVESRPKRVGQALDTFARAA